MGGVSDRTVYPTAWSDLGSPALTAQGHEVPYGSKVPHGKRTGACYNRTMKTVRADEAESRFGRILTDVRAGESYTITLDGEPVAVLEPVAATAVRNDELRQAVQRLKDFGRSHPCPRAELKSLIEEGRRF